MGHKMRNAPVYYAILQVKYNPVLNFARYADQIHDELRKAGFPDVRQSHQTKFQISLGGLGEESPPAVASAEKADLFLFLSADGVRGLVFASDALSYQTTNYDTFELFSKDFVRCLEIVNRHLGIEYSERVGLRYLDAIVPPTAEELPLFVVPGVLGLAGLLPDESQIAQTMNETVFISPDDIQVTSRVVVRHGKLAFAADIASQGLKFSERFQTIDSVHAVLDTDASFSSRRNFDMEEIKMKMTELHDKVEVAFRATVTPHALEQWS